MRPRTVVWVSPVPGTPGRWRVRVAYPTGKPTSLVSCSSRDEAVAAARWYAARYCWQLDHTDDGGEGGECR